MTPNCVQVLRDRKSHLTEAGTVALRQYDKGTPGRASTTWYRRTLLGTLPTFARTCEGSHTWTVAELPIGSKARLALAHLTYTGVRRSDVVKPGRQRVRDGCITIAVQKNRRRKPIAIELPILALLQNVMCCEPHGRPHVPDDRVWPTSHSQWLRESVQTALRRSGPAQCSAYGLCKAGAARPATTHELMAIFGWQTVKEAEAFTRAADRHLSW